MTALAHGAIKRTVEPAVEPISLQRAKEHLRVKHSQEDNQILRIIRAARRRAESFSGLALITQTWRLRRDHWWSFALELPNPPLQSVSSISYLDTDGASQTLVENTDYRVLVDSRALVWAPSRVPPSLELDAKERITITFVSGFGATPETVPETIRQAVLVEVAHLWRFRGDDMESVEPSATFRNLLLAEMEDYL